MLDCDEVICVVMIVDWLLFISHCLDGLYAHGLDGWQQTRKGAEHEECYNDGYRMGETQLEVGFAEYRVCGGEIGDAEDDCRK